jgi:hypothetical protein
MIGKPLTPESASRIPYDAEVIHRASKARFRFIVYVPLNSSATFGSGMHLKYPTDGDFNIPDMMLSEWARWWPDGTDIATAEAMELINHKAPFRLALFVEGVKIAPRKHWLIQNVSSVAVGSEEDK